MISDLASRKSIYELMDRYATPKSMNSYDREHLINYIFHLKRELTQKDEIIEKLLDEKGKNEKR